MTDVVLVVADVVKVQSVNIVLGDDVGEQIGEEVYYIWIRWVEPGGSVLPVGEYPACFILLCPFWMEFEHRTELVSVTCTEHPGPYVNFHAKFVCLIDDNCERIFLPIPVLGVLDAEIVFEDCGSVR